jgi:hypothetical protein
MGIEITLLVLWSYHNFVKNAVPNAVLCLFSALVIAELSLFEHRKAIRPSTLLCVFILCSIAFDVVQVRTLFMRSGSNGISGLVITGIGVKFFMLLIESRGKLSLLHPSYQRLFTRSRCRHI